MRVYIVRGLAFFFLALSLLIGSASGQVDVFLDFQSDIHDGNNGAANGVADWIDELNQATGSISGVADFTAAERATIQTNIQTHLVSMFSPYNVSFNTSGATGSGDIMNFGVEAGTGVLGFAPLDIGNLFSGQTTNVAPEAFGFFLESGDSRADQINEISLGLAGTAAHEMGHSIGLLHHHAYSNEGITPANYAATGGLQNNHIIATGSTGLNEVGRETIRTFSPFSKVMLDITGGAESIFTGQDNDSLVLNPVISDRSENGGFSGLGTDAGSTIATAQTVTLTTGETSNAEIGFVEADLDSAGNFDIDVFKFTTTQSGTVSGHVYSTDLVYGAGAEFDPMLELLDSSGTVIATIDDMQYDGNDFAGGTNRDDDPFIVNIDLVMAGDYYFRVTSAGGGEVGSNYWLVFGFTPNAVPEPSGLAFLILGLVGVSARRRRHS